MYHKIKRKHQFEFVSRFSDFSKADILIFCVERTKRTLLAAFRAHIVTVTIYLLALRCRYIFFGVYGTKRDLYRG